MPGPISARFPDGDHRAAAAMLLGDCAAFRLGQPVVASVCLHRVPDGRFLVLIPCGVCRERLATHGPEVLVAVADAGDPTVVRWVPLRAALPHYWMSVFPEELPAWQR